MSETLELAKKLINIQSITPDDNGCQAILIQQLKALGFNIVNLPSGNVTNFWAQRGKQQPLVIFAGHTDVVPSGPEDKWISPPFNATVRDHHLYGRGAADMKSAVAAMIIGCKNFINQFPEHEGSIGFIITSDEEGNATDGTIKVVDYLQAEGIKIDYCIIGEASSNARLGDVVKVGRRGSLHGYLQVFGKQGHIAYPHLADNPIHRCFKALDTLSHMEWDQGNEYFSPTSFQIYKISADTGASNIIPGSLTAKFNFRYSPASTAEQLQKQVHQIFDEHELHYQVKWNSSSQPFLSPEGKLIQACKAVIKEVCDLDTQPNTTGGTSDGRFITATGCEIVELGHCNETIHQVNENVNVENIETLAKLYEKILQYLLVAR